jgi:hypothetical protein
MAALWAAAPCSLVGVHDVSEAFAASIIRTMKVIMEATSTSETSMNFYQTTRRCNPEEHHIYFRRHENFQFRLTFVSDLAEW